MKATDFTRDDCALGKKRVSYRTLKREYRCAECGGRVVIRTDVEYLRDSRDVMLTIWYPCCGRCWGRDFIHEAAYARQQAEAIEVLDGLPPELRDLARGKAT